MWQRTAALILLYGLVEYAAVSAARPEFDVGEFAPVGLAAGILLMNRLRTWWLVSLLVWSATTLAHVGAGDAWLLAAVWGVAHGVGAMATAAMLRRTCLDGDAPRLETSANFRQYLSAATAGALVGTIIITIASPATLDSGLALTVVATGLGHFSSYLVLLPFFMRTMSDAGEAKAGERVALWLTLIVLGIGGSFVPWPIRSLASVGWIVTLSWFARRLPLRDTLMALLGTAILSNVMGVRGLGEFGFLVKIDHLAWVLPATAFFVTACAMVSVPFAVAVGWQRQLSRSAVSEANKLQRVVDSASAIAIIGTDAQGRISLFNPGAVSMLGYELHEVLGQPPSMFYTNDEIARIADLLGVRHDYREVARAMAVPEVSGLEIEFVRKDGERRVHLMSLSPLLDDLGVVVGYVSTAEDVSERVRTQLTLEKALARERDAVERLREVDRVKENFVSTVSHELRTPITSIMGYLEVLTDGGFGEVNDRQLDALGRVHSNSQRLLLLIDDLLALSQVQEGGLASAHVELDLREVMLAACEVVTPSAERAGVRCHQVLPHGATPFVGDRDQLERVLVNLMGNAVKFSTAGDRVVARLAVVDGHYLIEISDTGIGIPIEEQGRLFTRFFRSSTALDRAIQGSGLGLSIAKAIVERHGGSIRVESEPDVGTIMSVSLPCPTRVEQAPETAEPRAH